MTILKSALVALTITSSAYGNTDIESLAKFVAAQQVQIQNYRQKLKKLLRFAAAL